MSPIVTVNPDSEKQDLIQPGQYGKDTPAVLTKATYAPNERLGGRMVLSLWVSVNDPKAGRMTRALDAIDWDSGSKVPRFLRQLGIDDEAQRKGFDTDSLADIQVLVDIGVEAYKKRDDPEGAKTGQKNVLKDIRKIGD